MPFAGKAKNLKVKSTSRQYYTCSIFGSPWGLNYWMLPTFEDVLKLYLLKTYQKKCSSSKTPSVKEITTIKTLKKIHLHKSFPPNSETK